jgi:hypothetical protein
MLIKTSKNLTAFVAVISLAAAMIGYSALAMTTTTTTSSSLAFAQGGGQQKKFTASMSGKNEVPPINTQATGTAKFTLNPNQTLSYELQANNINGVIGAHVIENNGSLLAEVLNPYEVHNGKPVIPTGEINGLLSKGTITADDLSSPAGKKISDLTNLMNEGKALVEVRTQKHENGEIRGQISTG